MNVAIGNASGNTYAFNGSHNTLVGASTSLGGATVAYGVALGKGAQVNGNGGVAIGPGAIAPADTIVIGTSNGTFTERIRVTPSGFVGIGTTTPTANLDVPGGVRFGTGASPDILLGGPQGMPFRSLAQEVIMNSNFGLSGSLTAGTSAMGSFTPGMMVNPGDTINCSPYSGAGGMTGNLVWSCFASGSTVKINLQCATGSSCTLPTDWRVSALRW